MSDRNEEFDPFAGKTGDSISKPKRSGKIIGIIAGVIVVIAIFAYLGYQGSLYNATSNPTSNAVAVDKVYVNRDYNFQMQYPAGWAVNEGTVLENMKGNMQQFEGFSYIVVFAGPAKDGYTVNINAVTENMQGYSLADYVAATKSDLAQALAANNYRLLNEQDMMISNHNAHNIFYVANFGGTQTKVLTTIVQDGDQAFIMSYAAPTSVFDTYQDIATRSMSTLKFLTQSGTTQQN